jgi:tetratricopeptide (TPR) repeat protein
MPRNKTSNRFGQSNDALAPPKLLAAARDSRLVIFAGAGISMGAPTNLPSWRDVNRVVVRSLAASAASAVGEPLAAKAADMILARHEQEKLPPEYQAQVLAEFLHDKYFGVLQHLDSDRPNPTHLAIAWLARLGCVRAVITTNFDRVLEAAFATVGTSLHRCFQPEDFRALASDLTRLDKKGGPCHLLKLHGSVDDPTTLIDTLAQRKRGFAAPVMDCVRHLLHSYHWLFLGFSGLDLEAERNYLALEQEAERAVGFTWFVREKTEPKPAVVRLKNIYGERGSLVYGSLPEWLLDFADSLTAEPRAWIDKHTRNAPAVDDKANTVALEKAATKWAADLTPSVSALSLTFVVFACAEPQTAVQLAERVFQALEQTTKARDQASSGLLLLKAVAANALGFLLAGLGQHEEAVRWLNTAVDLAETAQDEDTRDRFRGNLAHSLEMLGRIDEARSAYQSALAGYRKRGEPALLAFGLSGLAAYFIRQLRLDEAQALAEEATQWATKAGDERFRGTALSLLGQIAKLKGDYPTALKLLTEVEELFRRLGNDEAVAAAAGNRGEVLAALGQFDEAQRIQQAVLRVDERLDRRDNQAANFLSFGTLAELQGDLASAEGWFNKALEAYGAIKNPLDEAFALYRLAGVKKKAGRFEDAILLAETALPRVNGRNALLTSDLWNEIGTASLRLGRIGRAEEAFRHVHILTEANGATKAHAAAAMNLGTILLLRQNDAEAVKFFVEAAEYWTQVDARKELEYCKLGEAAVRLDQKIAALSDAGHAARTSSEMRAAATEMIGLYPELIEMYAKIGATQLVAEFCSSAASTAKFVGESGKAGRWYRRAADVFRSMGLADRERESLDRSEDLLRHWTNALMENGESARALPDVLLLAEVAEQLGHGEMCASALLNAAIIVVRTSQDYARAKALAERSLALLPANSSDVASAQMVISHCNDPDRDSTRLAAPPRGDDVAAVAPGSLLWIQYRSGKVHTLILTNGKIVVLGFTTSEMALRVLDLIVHRFPGDDLLIAQTEGSARATFEQGCVADGARAEDYWFVYEGTDEFAKIIASLEVQQPPPA